MTTFRALLLLLLPIFAGCQSLPWNHTSAESPTERLQGQLGLSDGKLLLRTCQGGREVELIDAGGTGLPDDVRMLAGGAAQPLFADVRGRLVSLSGGTQQLQLTQVYRLQREGSGCKASGADQITLLAAGHEPDWSVEISPQGMLLERPAQSPLALPYVEEQLPDGQSSFSSEANDERLDLWVAPQRCVDSSTGTVSHLTAELRLDDQTLRGCAYRKGPSDN
jgi:putative lipoprotein